MSARTLSADDIGHPEFPPGTAQDGVVFDLSSHRRARDALELALAVHEPGFNVFVLGEDRSGRLTSTVAFLEQSVEPLPAPDDWVYVNNFQRPWEPIPVRLQQSEGRRLHDRMQHLLAQLGEAVQAAFGGDSFQKRMQSEGESARDRINARIKEIQEEARAVGLDVLQTEQGPMIVAIDEKGEAVGPDALNAEQRAALEQHGPRIAEDIREVGRRTAEAQAELRERADELGRQTADYTFGPLIDAFVAEFAMHSGLTRWLVELRNDMVDHYRTFLPAPPDSERPREFDPAHRYAINLFVDNRAGRHAPVVVEANPTYENLFGRIEYRQSQRSMETDFTLIRAGALHRANGGVLVLRADAVASAPGVWPYLKAALRDRVVRIEEPYRFNGPAVAGAPTPGPIPIDLKVVMIASPRWYYTFYAADPEFRNYFGVKADIDPEVDATQGNLETYGGMIRSMALRREKGLACEDGAVSWLLGLASRWAADRAKLSSQFERVDDIIAEAQVLARRAGATSISRELVVQAHENRRRRNSRIEDRIQEGIADRSVLITTTGTMVGQVNALTVRDFGDHAFGTPSRVTARASVGRRGVLNIERDVGLGGPIQQKGALVLQGWLSGRFARTYPLSFDVSITFEQSYGGVDGDSASLAELVAILSDLSGVPVRQGLAITGSVNQRGEAQAIGGAHHKVEGFFRTCVEAGTLDGSQGVAVPAANEDNLVLNVEVEAAVRDGTFSLYSLATIEDAVELFLGMPAGEAGPDGSYPADTVFGRVAAQLQAYDRALTERQRPV
ncbi:MAG: ATP-binding protein [Rhodospirillaceae bacterium]